MLFSVCNRVLSKFSWNSVLASASKSLNRTPELKIKVAVSGTVNTFQPMFSKKFLIRLTLVVLPAQGPPVNTTRCIRLKSPKRKELLLKLGEDDLCPTVFYLYLGIIFSHVIEMGSVLIIGQLL